MGSKKKRNQPQVEEHELHVLSNDPQSWKYDLLEMLLSGVLNNQIGYMDAMNQETGEIERLIVGLEPNAEGKVGAYPLARLLDQEELTKYLAPDGNGAFGV